MLCWKLNKNLILFVKRIMYSKYYNLIQRFIRLRLLCTRSVWVVEEVPLNAREDDYIVNCEMNIVMTSKAEEIWHEIQFNFANSLTKHPLIRVFWIFLQIVLPFSESNCVSPQHPSTHIYYNHWTLFRPFISPVLEPLREPSVLDNLIESLLCSFLGPLLRPYLKALQVFILNFYLRLL